MRVRLIEGHPRIEATRNQVAVMRGPLVYCLESPDLPEGVRLSDVAVRPALWHARHRPELLGGVTVLEGEADIRQPRAWNGTLYRELLPQALDRRTVTLIPYYTCANRGVSEMTIWFALRR